MWLGRRHYFRNLQRLMTGEDGQDLVEYALLIAMLVVTATASSGPMAIVITTELSNIAAAFTGAV